MQQQNEWSNPVTGGITAYLFGRAAEVPQGVARIVRPLGRMPDPVIRTEKVARMAQGVSRQPIQNVLKESSRPMMAQVVAKHAGVSETTARRSLSELLSAHGAYAQNIGGRRLYADTQLKLKTFAEANAPVSKALRIPAIVGHMAAVRKTMETTSLRRVCCKDICAITGLGPDTVRAAFSALLRAGLASSQKMGGVTYLELKA